jgi:hypothetical protein
MDGQVEDDWDPGDGGMAEELSVAQKGSGAVVVGVQECERLLLEEEEDGVEEFEVLGQVVELWSMSAIDVMCKTVQTYVVQDNKRRRPSTIVVANGVEHASPHQRWNQLLQKQQQQYSTNRRQVKVVNLEQSVQFQRLPILHNFPSTEDDDVVCDERPCRLGHARHGGGPGLESKMLGLVAQ